MSQVRETERRGESEVSAASPGPGPAITTSRLRKEYGSIVAVDGLTIQVERGEVFGFLGPNGAGKSTVVKMLTGLVRPTSGDARLLGQPLGDREAKRRLGYLPELFRFHDWLTGNEFLDVHGKLYGMSAADRRRRIPEVLALVGLQDSGERRIRMYSKGMQQRIGLAQALLHEPELVFLDEPTSALDPLGRRDVRAVIRELKRRGMTVFLNSHLLSEVEMVCDRVAIMDRGSLVAQGPLDDLLNRELVVELRLGNWTDDLRRVLEDASRIEHLEIGNNGAGARATITVQDDEAVAGLVDRLVRSGAAVYSVTPHQQELEEFFVGLVERPDDGAAGR